jgi:hypothetical protein
MLLSEIPTYVLEDVRQKWETAYRWGWSKWVWDWCAMCTYMGEEEVEPRCECCPLSFPVYGNYAWCRRGFGDESLLFGKGEAQESWRAAVRAFLDMIENELEGRRVA